MSFRWPLDNFTISQGFGSDPDYYKQYGQIGHNGLDLAAPVGTPVHAADDGVIAFEGWGKSGAAGYPGWMGDPAGICILINNTGSYSGYAHLASTVVNKGQSVSKGQVIGYVGQTGAATGPHLHFEMLPLSPNFSNGYAGRINPMPYIETTTNATDAQIRQAYLDILERPADDGGLAHYRAYPIDFVRQDIANSQEKRDLDARKAAAAQQAAQEAAQAAAQQAADAQKAAEAKAAEKAAQDAAAAKAAADAEAARVAEEERIAKEAAEAKAQSQADIAGTATGGGDMTTPEDKVEPVQPIQPKTPTDATKSASVFVARIASQVSAAYVIARGVADILLQQVSLHLSDITVGWMTIAIAAVLIFWAQFGYQMAENAGWKWAANLKWPF